MSRRGNGEGTIYYSEKLNKWIGQFTVGRKPDGRINRKSIYGNTRKEVKEKMTKALSEIQNSTYIEKNNITVYEYGKHIIDNKLETNRIKDTTFNTYYYPLNKIKSSNIAHIPIQKITSSILQTFFNSCKSLSNSYLEKIDILLNLIFEEAIKDDCIIKNPMRNVIRPKSLREDKQVESLTIEEEKLFLAKIEDKLYKNIYYIALFTRNAYRRNSCTTKK